MDSEVGIISANLNIDDVAKARLYYETAHQAAQHAVEAGPDSADAHSTLGYVLFQAQLRIADARAPFERSFELGRGEATTLARYAAFAAATKQNAKAMRQKTEEHAEQSRLQRIEQERTKAMQAAEAERIRIQQLIS